MGPGRTPGKKRGNLSFLRDPPPRQGEITWGGNLPGKGFYLLESSFSWFCRAGIHSPRDSSQKIQPRVGSPPLKITCSTEPRETTLQQVEPRIWGGPGRAITEGLGACLPMLSPLVPGLFSPPYNNQRQLRTRQPGSPVGVVNSRSPNPPPS